MLSRGDYHWQHEPCWYAVRKTGKGHWAGDRKQTTLWQISSRDQDAETVHGTQKPVECMRRPILNNSSPGQAVYEPFMGSGTTLIAAETTGRVCLGIELNPAYVDVAVERWQRFTGKAAVLDGSGESFADLAASNAEAVDDVALHAPGGAPGTGAIACSGSRSAPAPAGSTSGSCSPVPDIALWVTSSGKPTPRPCSWRGWKTRPWIARLSGTTLPPSTAARGAARWTSSARAIRASRFRSPAGGSARPTRATSGRTSRASSARCEPPFVFLENVAHHLRLGFPEVAGDLVGLGYRLAAGLFTAAEVGAPHRRERLFILAHPRG